MAEKTEIAWCDSTFNPWIGCQKVSAGCDNCYAETLMDKRYHKVEWGPHGERKRTSEANWKQPLRWAKAARGTGRRPRVFCASLGDVFDNHVEQSWRIDLFDLIDATEELDWLILTKRPENVAKMLPTNWGDGRENVWLGTTCEDQEAYDRRWPILRDIPAAVHFISYEPAIGPLRLPLSGPYPDWLICGGESGSGYRPMKAVWEQDIRWDCEQAGVAYFFKQFAGKRPIPPNFLVVRQFPVAA